MPKLFDLKRKILTDLKVELLDEFDRNFHAGLFSTAPGQDGNLRGTVTSFLMIQDMAVTVFGGPSGRTALSSRPIRPTWGCTTGAERSRSHPGCGNTFGTCIAKMPKALPTQSRSVRPTIPSVIECCQRRRSSGKIWL